MSAKDDLDSFDRDWARHCEWRQGERRGGQETPTSYRCDRGGGSGPGLNLDTVPRSVRDAFLADLEAIMHKELNERHAAVRAGLVERAVAEAKATLRELTPTQHQLGIK